MECHNAMERRETRWIHKVGGDELFITCKKSLHKFSYTLIQVPVQKKNRQVHET